MNEWQSRHLRLKEREGKLSAWHMGAEGCNTKKGLTGRREGMWSLSGEGSMRVTLPATSGRMESPESSGGRLFQSPRGVMSYGH